MDSNLEYRIRPRAYELWAEDGKPAGKHLDYWLAAEKDVTGDTVEDEREDSFPASDPPSSIMRGG